MFLMPVDPAAETENGQKKMELKISVGFVFFFFFNVVWRGIDIKLWINYAEHMGECGEASPGANPILNATRFCAAEATSTFYVNSHCFDFCLSPVQSCPLGSTGSHLQFNAYLLPPCHLLPMHVDLYIT